jgi:hypothetical protein
VIPSPTLLLLAFPLGFAAFLGPLRFDDAALVGVCVSSAWPSNSNVTLGVFFPLDFALVGVGVGAVPGPGPFCRSNMIPGDPVCWASPSRTCGDAATCDRAYSAWRWA